MQATQIQGSLKLRKGLPRTNNPVLTQKIQNVAENKTNKIEHKQAPVRTIDSMKYESHSNMPPLPKRSTRQEPTRTTREKISSPVQPRLLVFVVDSQ